ncbi:hypothetical protein [Microbaculum sp. FT89]|uniref:hypothetical protein n=1 Tax=Microbaculum sp. FT89 TaxID=3447298 RepID=UPI003F52ECED
MDASIAGRAQTLPLTESWARPAPAGEATLVPPARAVRPPNDAERTRDKKKDGPGNQRNGNRSGAQAQHDASTAPPLETAPTADSSTGRTRPEVTPEIPLPLEALSDDGGSRLDGLMVKRAYARRDVASPRIVKSA